MLRIDLDITVFVDDSKELIIITETIESNEQYLGDEQLDGNILIEQIVI